MTTFFRLLKDTDKATALRGAVAAYRAGKPDTERTFTVDPEKFRKVPNTPFAYWVDDSIRDLFVKLPPFESEGRTVRVGLQTSDDFRFVRAWWEVDADRRLDPVEGGAPNWRDDLEGFQKWCRNRTHQGKYWVPFAKGGEYSPYYSDIHLVVNWKNEGEEMKAFAGSVIRNPDYYFRPGVTWPASTVKGLNVRPLPAGSIFGHKGPVAFPETDERAMLRTLGVFNSSVFEQLVYLQNGSRAWEVGLVQATPLPPLSEPQSRSAVADVSRAIAALRDVVELNEASGEYEGVAFDSALRRKRVRTAEERLIGTTTHLDMMCAEAYGLLKQSGPTDVPAVGAETGLDLGKDLDHASLVLTEEMPSIAHQLFGLIFGRYRLRRGDAASKPDTAGTFDPRPVPSATVVGPLAQYHSVLELARDGDVYEDGLIHYTTRLVELANLSYSSSTDFPALLLHYISEGFFAAHLAAYSKSRRKAPIYWPLSTPSASYTTWVYYPRLDEATLFTAYQLAREKHDLVQKELAELQAIPQAERTKQQRKRFDEVARDVTEVHEFAEEILRVTRLPYKPDHDDGVPICAAPLYRLFGHREWAKYLEGIWEDLQSGKYDWAHLAFAIWPDRVREKAAKDISIAIAHGLEHQG